MTFSDLIFPLILTLFGCYCVFSKKEVMPSFIEGANDGIKSAFSILPGLVLLMSAISMFSASGASDLLSELISPVISRLGIPSELAPLLIVRPLSGSGSTALLTDIFDKYGADSIIGKCASVLSGSSDTVFYVTALYMSGAGVKNARYTLPLAITVMLFGTVLSCLLAKLIV